MEFTPEVKAALKAAVERERKKLDVRATPSYSPSEARPAIMWRACDWPGWARSPLRAIFSAGVPRSAFERGAR